MDWTEIDRFIRAVLHDPEKRELLLELLTQECFSMEKQPEELARTIEEREFVPITAE